VLGLTLLLRATLPFSFKCYISHLVVLGSCTVCILTVFLAFWFPILQFFVAMVCHAMVWIACWSVHTASTCFLCWVLNFCSAVHNFLFFPMFLAFRLIVYLLHSPDPFFFHLGVDGLVWRSVVQLGCLSLASPGSDSGFFPLVCCW